MKSKKTTSSTQTSTPTAAPELRFALGQNQNLFNLLSGREAAPFSTVAPFNNAQNTAFDLGIDRALGGSPATAAASGAVTDIAGTGGLPMGASDFFGRLSSGDASNPAADYFLSTARGDYLDPASNPAFALGSEAIANQVGSIFERAGRTGSGANKSSVARGVADLASNLINQERGRQLTAAGALGDLYNSDVSNAFGAGSLLDSNARSRLAAAGLAPSIAETDYRNINALLNIGNQQQGQSQNEIADALYRYNFPYENAINANAILTSGTGSLAPLLGGTQTGKTTETSSPGLFNSILGGVLTGASLFGGGGPLGGLFGGGGASAGGAIPSGFSYQSSSPAPSISPAAIASGFNPFLFSSAPSSI